MADRIRWGNSDAKKLANKVRQFNAKITRVEKKHPELKDILPKRITKEDKLKMTETIKENKREFFNKELKSLDRFLKPGAENIKTSKTGIVITSWELKEIKRKYNEAEKIKAKEREKAENMEATTQGKPIGLKRGEMGSVRMNELKPKKEFDFDKIKKGKEWDLFKERVDKASIPKNQEKKWELYKENYLKSLNTVYGDYADVVRNYVERLPAEQVVNVYYQEQEANIDFHYFDKTDEDTKIEILENIWKRAYENYKDNEANG
jgi:hypothetical protein